ncbi:hypothetical protein FKF97_10180 [Clostridium perfringens]|nr:hypothetical protein [Clostridium perfringens]
MLELLKSIDIENTSIKMIKETLEETRKELGDYLYKSDISEFEKSYIHKILGLMDKTDIMDLSFKELKEYINNLMFVINFIHN